MAIPFIYLLVPSLLPFYYFMLLGEIISEYAFPMIALIFTLAVLLFALSCMVDFLGYCIKQILQCIRQIFGRAS